MAKRAPARCVIPFSLILSFVDKAFTAGPSRGERENDLRRYIQWVASACCVGKVVVPRRHMVVVRRCVNHAKFHRTPTHPIK